MAKICNRTNSICVCVHSFVSRDLLSHDSRACTSVTFATVATLLRVVFRRSLNYYIGAEIQDMAIY